MRKRLVHVLDDMVLEIKQKPNLTLDEEFETYYMMRCYDLVRVGDKTGAQYYHAMYSAVKQRVLRTTHSECQEVDG